MLVTNHSQVIFLLFAKPAIDLLTGNLKYFQVCAITLASSQSAYETIKFAPTLSKWVRESENLGISVELNGLLPYSVKILDPVVAYGGSI